MASVQQVTVSSSQIRQSGSAAAARRSSLVVIAAIAIAVFFGLWTTYSSMNAGVDYPEPWAQVTR